MNLNISGDVLITPERSVILFDFDGTLVDSGPGILKYLKWAAEDLGYPEIPETDLNSFLGPPMQLELSSYYGIPKDEAQVIVEHYRSKYEVDGVLEAEVYAGVTDLLDALSEANFPLAIATSKPERTATAMLHNFDLAKYFTVITGDDHEGSRPSKAAVVTEAIIRLNNAGISTASPLMVGDRHHDVIGAKANGIETAFARWGYGSPVESEGAAYVLNQPSDLLGIIGIE